MSLLFPWSSECWKFDLPFLCLFYRMQRWIFFFFFFLRTAQSHSLLCKKKEVGLDSPPGVWTEPRIVWVPGSLMVRNEFDGECENLGTVQTPSWSGSAITLCSYSLFSATLHNTLVQLDHEGLSEWTICKSLNWLESLWIKMATSHLPSMFLH